MNKLESYTRIIHHVAYGVDIEILNYKSDYVGIQRAKSNGFYYIGDDLYITYKGGSTGKKLGSECLLYLHPLSDLSKMIQVAEYFCSFQDHVNRIDDEYNIELDSFSNELFITDICNLNLMEITRVNKIYQFLYSCHFDIDGLIPKSLAIDINTL